MKLTVSGARHMKNFARENTNVSLCGLNCLLCTMHIGGYCPRCGGGSGNQGCAIARCGMAHQVEFCSLCPEYPCAKYDGIDAADSFITHLNQKSNLKKSIGWVWRRIVYSWIKEDGYYITIVACWRYTAKRDTCLYCMA